MPEPKAYILPMPQKRGVIYFAVANVLAFASCAAVWALIWYGEFFTGAATAVWAWLAANAGFTVFAALSPLFAALMLGYGYMRRAMARRARERDESLAAAAAAVGTQLPALK